MEAGGSQSHSQKPAFFPFLSLVNQVYNFASNSSTTNLIWIFHLRLRLSSRVLPRAYCFIILPIFIIFYHPTSLPCFQKNNLYTVSFHLYTLIYHCNCTTWRVHAIKLLAVQFSRNVCSLFTHISSTALYSIATSHSCLFLRVRDEVTKLQTREKHMGNCNYC